MQIRLVSGGKSITDANILSQDIEPVACKKTLIYKHQFAIRNFEKSQCEHETEVMNILLLIAILKSIFVNDAQGTPTKCRQNAQCEEIRPHPGRQCARNLIESFI